MSQTEDSGATRPIRVLEDERNYLVHIHPRDRDRAKKIRSRRWDGGRQAWVYPKDYPSYDALVEEFEDDAQEFSIQPPLPEVLTEQLNSVTALPDDDDLLAEVEEERADLREELGNIRQVLGSITDSISDHGRTLSYLREQQDETKRALGKIDSKSDGPAATAVVERLPDSLNLSRSEHIALLEAALVEIAYAACGEDGKLKATLRCYSAVSQPYEFVMQLHEDLKIHLLDMVEGTSHSSFSDLITLAYNEQIYSDRGVIPSLRSMNGIRNDFAHGAGLSPQQAQAGAIRYLFTLASIWRSFMSSSGGTAR